MGEAARDVDRNDMICGQIIDRAIDNKLQGGFTPNPNSGDQQLDADLPARWKEEASDANLCDPAGQLTFHDQERMVMRETAVVGDIFALPMRDGTVQLVEFHRCRSPHIKSKLNKRIVHGVEFANDKRRRAKYWFTTEPKNPADQVNKKDLTPIDAYDQSGEPQVWHHYYPKRPSQTRGVTAGPDLRHGQLPRRHPLLAAAQATTQFVLSADPPTDPGVEQQPPEHPQARHGAGGDFIGSRPVEDFGPGTEIGTGENETVTPGAPISRRLRRCSTCGWCCRSSASTGCLW